MSSKIDPNDPTTWPIVDAIPTDIFLGEFVHDCTPYLTEEQKSWPIVDAIPTDIFLGVYTEVCTPKPKGSAPPPAPQAEQPPQQPT